MANNVESSATTQMDAAHTAIANTLEQVVPISCLSQGCTLRNTSYARLRIKFDYFRENITRAHSSLLVSQTPPVPAPVPAPPPLPLNRSNPPSHSGLGHLHAQHRQQQQHKTDEEEAIDTHTRRHHTAGPAHTRCCR